MFIGFWYSIIPPPHHHLINRNSICGQLHSRTHYRRIDCTQHTMKRMNTREGGSERGVN